MPHTCYGNTDNKIYIKSLSEHFVYDFDTNETYRTHLSNATHYHLNGRLYSTRHIWNVTHPISVFFIDGEEVSSYKDIPAHDRTLNHFGEWEMYIRSYPLTDNKVYRQISSDFINWTSPKPVKLNGLAQNEMIYSFGNFKIGNQEYGIGNILTSGDPFHSPNYHGGEYKIYPRAFKQIDKYEWNMLPVRFDDIVKDYEQCFIGIVVKGEIAYMTTQESMRKHASYCNIHEMESKPVSSRIFEMPVTELLSLLQPQHCS